MSEISDPPEVLRRLHGEQSYFSGGVAAAAVSAVEHWGSWPESTETGWPWCMVVKCLGCQPTPTGSEQIIGILSSVRSVLRSSYSVPLITCM